MINEKLTIKYKNKFIIRGGKEMPYIICQSCGNGSMQTLDINICSRCIKLGNDKTKILAIKKYLEKHPEAKFQEVSQALGISREVMDRLLKEGSLMLVQDGEKICIKEQEKDKDEIKREQKIQNLIKQKSNKYKYTKQRLKKEERTIVIMYIYMGMKHREIAEITGLPLSTVLSKYNRALKKMKSKIEA